MGDTSVFCSVELRLVSLLSFVIMKSRKYLFMPKSILQNPPTLSPALRALVASMSEDLASDSHRITVNILQMVPEYKAVNDQIAARELGEAVQANLALWYRALLERIPIDDEVFEQIRISSSRRVHQGISLSGLLHAFRAGSQDFWFLMLDAVRDLPELHRELLFNVSPYLLAHFDRVARDSASAYLTEMHQSSRWRSRLRAEIWNIARNRPDDDESFRRHAAALGLDVTPAYATLAMKTADLPSTPSQQESQLDRMIDGAARALGLKRLRLFRVFHADCLLVWAPVPGGVSLLDFDHQLASQAERMLENVPNITAIGIGLPGVGAPGWALSAEQAMKSLQMQGDSTNNAVYCYSDRVLDDAISQLANTARYFDAIVERLAQEANLLDTLKAYFYHHQQRKTTAAKLHVHPNTLDYRLGRIEEILGARLDDPAWQAKLYIALRRSN
ncbi:helix-turn-helix domain-containing protein [Zhongshania borealis]|uniref:Helix-turn-helix domain-containing protein n=2 Tax=Zhongshania borealis TaxID=889488 RepID=A0ABP7WRN8_9GAMM